MTPEEFSKDDKTVFAVTRGLEIIGEATKRIPAQLCGANILKYPGVRWQECGIS